MHDWAELVQGAGEHGGGLGLAGVQSALLVSGLVEPGLHKALPMFAEVSVRELVVVLNHLADLYIQ